MKRVALLVVSVPPDAQGEWQGLIAPYALKIKWIEPLNRKRGKAAAYCDVDIDDPKYKDLVAMLTARGLRSPEDTAAPDYEARYDAVLHSPGVTWRIQRIEQNYTDAELRSFPLLHLMVEREEIDPFGPSHGTTFCLSTACPRCGAGALQTSPFYSPAKSFPKTGLICASSTEKFVAGPLADALRRAETTGLELRQVHSHREHEPLPWWQIIPRFTMPRMSAATRGIVRDEKLPPCPKCRRDGHYHTTSEPERITYAAADVEVDELPDVVQTWESFGRSYINREDFKRSRFTEPAILVKPCVFDIFRRLKVKHARFAPVRVE